MTDERLDEIARLNVVEIRELLGHIDDLTAENERLRAALDDIENMPRYDQDDAHRLRHKAKKAKEANDEH